jgi:diguanylate cyclase (GGDEF)-like protein/PAS domain S-box-containing protein
MTVCTAKNCALVAKHVVPVFPVQPGSGVDCVALKEQNSKELIRLLLLEDNLADKTLVQIHLSAISDCTFDIEWCRTVAEARAELESRPEDFDIVFVDYNLPDGKGLDLVNEMANRLTAPMILLTGHNSREIDIEAMASGAADFLPKDLLDDQILERCIRYSIERRQHSHKLRTSVSQLEATNRQLTDTTARREAEVANVIKLAEHLAKPPDQADQININSHVLDGHRSSYESVAEACTVGVWQIQPDGLSIHTNTHMCRLLGLDPDIAPEELYFTPQFAEPDRRRAEREMAVWKSGMASSFESRFATVSADSFRDLAISGCPVLDINGEAESIIVTVMDVTERRQAESIVRELAQKDPLTSLLNRTTFLDLLPSAVAINQRNGTHVALLYIDLDNFKTINDTYGHQAGDEVLKMVARKLQSCIRESDFAARIGGDEFTVALSNLNSPMGAAAVAENILEAMREPWTVEGEPLKIRMSIGIAIDDKCTPRQCLKNADLALYRCKRDGGDAYQFFDPGMLEIVERRLKCEADLETAVTHDEFQLHYQPQISLIDGSMTGMEALIRWNRPDFGLVGPGEFMEVAEDNGAIIEIGNWVARTACDQIASLPSGVPISINISAKELRQPNLAATLMAIVETAEIPAERLIVEITESAVIEDLEKSAQIVADIRRCGIKVSLDDFGTGYSSLSILKRLPVDSLKIDGSFISNICNDEVDAAIVETIIDLGRRMDLRVVAECIETEGQARKLVNMGCTEAQGFFYCRPCPVDEIAAWQQSESLRAAG